MKSSITNIISRFLVLAAAVVLLTGQVSAQKLIVNDNAPIEGETDNTANVINIETGDVEEEKKVDKKETNVVKIETNESAGFQKEELNGGTWVLTGVESKAYNGINITKWQNGSNGNQVLGNCSWKDVLEIVHTVESGFRWQDPPKSMQPGNYLNLEAVYTNVDYSTTAAIQTGVKMFFASTKQDVRQMSPDAVEILKLNKDNKQYANEVKKGFFYAPQTLFDETNKCQLVVDCYVGKDHYVTTYTYVYQQ